MLTSPGARRLRTVTGLIIGIYVTMHLSNHALGLVSIRAQEAARPWVMALWHSPPGQVLLYGSVFTHALLGLASLYARRHFRMPAWEAWQLLLGLAIPYFLLLHVVNTRGTRILTGIDISYPYEIANLWIDPWTRGRQVVLVLLVWGHFVRGAALLAPAAGVVSARLSLDADRVRGAADGGAARLCGSRHGRLDARRGASGMVAEDAHAGRAGRSARRAHARFPEAMGRAGVAGAGGPVFGVAWLRNAWRGGGSSR